MEKRRNGSQGEGIRKAIAEVFGVEVVLGREVNLDPSRKIHGRFRFKSEKRAEHVDSLRQHYPYNLPRLPMLV